jgi:hypothetical protein
LSFNPITSFQQWSNPFLCNHGPIMSMHLHRQV